MDAILFKCPTTGQHIRWIAEEVLSSKDEEQPYTSIICPACIRLHFLNRYTGKLLGER